MKKILVTGCNGQLGRAIQKEYGDSVEFILTDVVEGKEFSPWILPMRKRCLILSAGSSPT